MPEYVTRLIDELIEREGGYVNDPRDRGGETKYGITKAVAIRNGYTGPMRDLPEGTARRIYFQQYFKQPGFYSVSLLAPKVAEELFDTGVNMGPAVASMFLQRALTALNRGGKDYPDIAADGAIGPATLAALQSYIRLRGDEGERVLLKALEALQGERYISLAERRGANEAFLYGWLRTRIGNVA